MRSIDPEQPIADVRTMDQWVSRSLELRRTPTMLLALFGAVALVLSAIGIYGVLAFGVAQRVREFGIRQALGADQQVDPGARAQAGPADRRRRHRARARCVGRRLALLQTLLFGVDRYDPTVFAGVTAVLLLVAVAACYVPARRATRIDPMVALRDV